MPMNNSLCIADSVVFRTEWRKEPEMVERYLEKAVTIEYSDYNNDRRRTTIVPKTLYWGNTIHRQQPQWMLEAMDLSKMELRTFELRNIHFWKEGE
jgi:hypothetical protein